MLIEKSIIKPNRGWARVNSSLNSPLYIDATSSVVKAKIEDWPTNLHRGHLLAKEATTRRFNPYAKC